MSRVSVDDLEWAATWLEGYDESDGDAEGDGGAYDTMMKVAAWLRAEARTREIAAAARAKGLTTAQAKAQLRAKGLL